MKQPAVKRYIVRLNDDERERPNALIQEGKSPARQVLKARILLKADASEAGEAFPAAEARRLVERFGWHYTSRHGSWLDMAESELSVLSRQYLDRRIPDKHALIVEVAAWQHNRNKNHTKVDWQFTIADARDKLKRLYPAQ